MSGETDIQRSRVSKENVERVTRYANKLMTIEAESVGFDRRLSVLLDELDKRQAKQQQQAQQEQVRQQLGMNRSG